MTKTIVIQDGVTNSSYIRIIKKEYYEEYEGFLNFCFAEYIIQVKKKILFFNIFVDIISWSSDKDNDETWCHFQAIETFNNIVYPFKSNI